ncbi:MAG: lysine 5,6-aminomutase subunit alpha TIM-barrel domain-containing protein [bacterium]|jgi:beta-lysine 5,6-aminomutase alpha subunit
MDNISQKNKLIKLIENNKYPSLNFDKSLLEKSLKLANLIVDDVFEFIKKRSTVSIERATLRIMGLDGANSEGVPYVNVLVDTLKKFNLLDYGASYFYAYLYSKFNDLNKIKQFLDDIYFKDISIENEFKEVLSNLNKFKEISYNIALDGVKVIEDQRKKREELIEKYGYPKLPWIYVIVATGNIFEDAIQAVSAVKQGADCIAVIRSSAQSLIDYVPEGYTTEGYGGTFATQANFRLMRETLDKNMTDRYLMLVNYSSGLCMPEIAAIAAIERLDMLLNDSMYGILFRDINPIRTFIDQYFSRLIINLSDIIINTGEDNYLTTADAFEKGYTVITSHFINYAFAKKCYLPDYLIGLGHAYEIRPEITNSFLFEFSQALLIRHLFPRCPLKYMPPTRWVTGNIFHTHVIDNMFNLVSVATGQHIHLVGILTEAIHTPLLQDRYLSIKSTKYVFNAAKDLGFEFIIRNNGIIEKRADYLLKKAYELLEYVYNKGLFEAIEEGVFADTKRPKDKGKGLEGVFIKNSYYYNPVEEIIVSKVKNKVSS